MNKKQQILAFLKSGGSGTVRQMQERFQISSVRNAITVLRKEGHPIISVAEKGNKNTVYSMVNKNSVSKLEKLAKAFKAGKMVSDEEISSVYGYPQAQVARQNIRGLGINMEYTMRDGVRYWYKAMTPEEKSKHIAYGPWV